MVVNTALRTDHASHRAALWLMACTLAGCTSVDLSAPPPVSERPATPASPPSVAAATTSPPVSAPGRRPGAYYQDDGPGETIPEGLLETPDAEPKIEPYAKGPSRPYTVFEQTYVPITHERPFVQRGIGSWYGKKFHGQRTASGEIYDMYKMTAAHPTLPIPSYARVTNLRNGKQVIVRINDRGPFHSSRIIDLSYTAALKLGYVRNGSTELEVERLLPEEIARLQRERRQRSLGEAPPSDPIADLAKAPAPVAVEAGGFFLQFGAYAQQQNAQAMRERLLAGWPPDVPSPSVVQTQGLYRLHSGPFSSREQASEAARLLRAAAQIQTVIVQR